MSTSEKTYASAPGATPLFQRCTFSEIAYQVVVPVILIIVVSVLRMPYMLWPHELNPDESQMLSQAMKYLIDPVPWRGVDGTSGGPLNSYFISLFLLCGFKADYLLIHALASILVCLLIFVTYRTLLRIGSNTGALLGILPMVFCFGFTSDVNFLHYSSELLPALFLTMGFYLFVVTAQSRRNERSSLVPTQLFICGFVLGMTPWCKLQALPIAGGLVLAVSSYLLASQAPHVMVRSYFPRFWLGVLLPSCLILSIVIKGGAFKDFWQSYILGNMAYAGQFALPRISFYLQSILWLPEMKLLTAAVFLAALTFVFSLRKRGDPDLRPEENWVLGGAASYVFLVLFVVCRPAIQFPHYAIFLIHPLTCLTVLLFSRSLPFRIPMKEGRLRLTVNVLAGCATIVFAAYAGVRMKDLRELPYQGPNASEQITATIQVMKQTSSIKSLAIWGWEPGVYVLSGIPPATRDSIGHFVISLGFSRPYFRERFVADLRREKPDLFIDAVAPGAFMWFWSERNGYESDAELKRFIDDHYILVRELSLKTGARPVRFFQRR